VDSSLPVLVSRLPDRRALTRLVRAALRHEIAQVELAHAPARAQAHTLDLHVAGQPPLALLAEPAGAPKNGCFPLRLRPLYRAQAAQLYALLEAENVPLDGPAPPDTSPTEVGATTLPLGTTKPDLGAIAEDPSLSVSVVFDPDDVSPSPADVEEPSLSVSVVFETDAPSSGHTIAQESFFDDVLANLPPPAEIDDEPTTYELSSDDVSLIESGPSDTSPVPPPDDSEDDFETLIRYPAQAAAAAPAIDDALIALPAPKKQSTGGGRKKRKSTRRKPNEAKHEEPRREAKSGDPAIGRRIAEGKYAIESLIGSGAAGAVYRATHRELRRTVAIKLLHPHYQHDPQFMTSFRGEALAASQLDHPNVMRVLDFGQEPDGLVYIVMEFLSGRTLQSLLDEERRLPTERAVEIMIQVCAALSVAHDHGIIHRDIKPDNIMLVPSRNDEGTTFELVKVCDFGIAALQNPRAEDADLAADSSVIAGTPEYMSPEQARGQDVDARSDVYACGICLYELVTGRPPFLGDHAGEILIKQLEETPKPPSQILRGLDPILEEVILRAIQKDPAKRHQSAREMRVELKELIEPGEGYDRDDQDERSIVENVPVLDDPASGFPGFFIAFSSAVLRFGRFERGHNEAAQAMKELQRSLRTALRGRSELTFGRRDVEKAIGYCVMTGTAEIVDLRRLLGSQLMGSFGEPFIQELVKKGIAALTLREGIPDLELQYIVEMLLGPFSGEELRRELLTKPLRHISVLFVSDVVGRDRMLSWKVGLCISRLARDLRALCNIRGISLKKMRETRDELIGGVARLLTRGEEVKQFLANDDLVDEAVANLRGFSSFEVAPLIVERILHEACAETAMLLVEELDSEDVDPAELRPQLAWFAQRLVTERSPTSDAAIAEFFRRKIIEEEDIPRDLREFIRAQTLADALVREPSQFLLTLDLIADANAYAHEMTTLEAAMGALARRAEAVALLAVMSTLARHAKGSGKAGRRENAALRTMKSMIEKQRLLPIANTLLVGPMHQREAARQLIVLAGSVGAAALYAAREATPDPTARPIFVKVMRDTGPAGWPLMAQVLQHLEIRDDAELTLVEDLLRAMPERADPVLGDAVAKFLAHPVLRPTALSAIVPLWGERAKKPLMDALEYADEPARIIALGELRRLRAIDEAVYIVIERFLTTRPGAGDELRAAASAALTDVAPPLRSRAIALLSKAVEGKRGFVALLRGGEGDDSVLVLEAMARALLALDRNEGLRALRSRVARSEGLMKSRLSSVLASA
jgi:eukaryotic-like serine/threonine-protein kinase